MRSLVFGACVFGICANFSALVTAAPFLSHPCKAHASVPSPALSLSSDLQSPLRLLETVDMQL